MGRVKIREIDAKRLLARHLSSEVPISFQNVQVTSDTIFEKLLRENPWLGTTRLVVKPDLLFGQRGKNNLVLVNTDFAGARAFLEERLNKPLQLKNVSGLLTHFIIEKFIPHKNEYYLSISSYREYTKICFSPSGGIEIEENWDHVRSLIVPVSESPTPEKIKETLVYDIEPVPNRVKIIDFFIALFKVFENLDFTFLEMNPFTFDENENLAVLDIRAELDSTAHFKSGKKWGNIEFPQPFGRVMAPEEAFVKSLDEKSGASLKLTILNPKGRIWTLVAGGGASVIFADTVADLGYGHELGNYGEYSGAPNEEETYQYAKTVISLATRNPDDKTRVLLIGGGIANFTDVAKTFEGIITAIKELQDDIKKAHIKVFVRRAGPNYQKGLKAMTKLGQDLGIPIDVHGPEIPMTSIIPDAIKALTA
jgi:ATP citrate (pro-S)-lyase